MKPDPSKHRPKDPEYVRELLDKAGLSQRAAARTLGVGDRTVRHWCAGTLAIPYTAQFALECLAKEKEQ